MSKLATGNPLGTSISSGELTADAITGQTASVAADDADSILIYDNSASALRKQTRAVFTSGLGASFTPLTAGDLTVVNDGSDGKPFVGTFTAAQVQALGAVTAGTLTIATLPAKTFVRNVFVKVTTVDLGGGSGTVSAGRTGATYVDYIAASAFVEFADIVLGDASAERGTNLTGYDLPSSTAWTATTPVLIRFTSSGVNLADINVTGTVVIDYMVFE
jgi:hypothetical protein